MSNLLGLAVALALHSQGAAHRVTHRRGDVVLVAPTDNPNAATPPTRPTRATPATPATPAVPTHKGGQSGSHRP